jgi:hypothetical protein
VLFEAEESAFGGREGSRALLEQRSISLAWPAPTRENRACLGLPARQGATARDGMSLGWAFSSQHSASVFQNTAEGGCAHDSFRTADPTGRKIGAENVNGFGVGVCQAVLFPSGHRPKSLLTAVFISPIIRSDRPRAASAGKPGKASNPAVCWAIVGSTVTAASCGLKTAPLTCGPKCLQSTALSS